MNRTQVCAATAFAFFVCVSFANANVVSLEANLDGLQVVPPNASPAFGLADATLDDSTGAFAITTASYQDLLGNSTFVGLFDAAVGTNGPLIFALTLDTPGAATGTFSGSGTLSAGQITDMLAGNTYVRISSTVFPSGEIRGQFNVVPEPSSLALLAVGALGAFAAGWRARKRKA